MRKIAIGLLVLVWTLLGRESLPGMVVTGSTNIRAAEQAAETLKKQIQADPELSRWMTRHRIGLAIQPYGQFHVLVVGPTRSPEERNQLKTALASYYPHLFSAVVSSDGFHPFADVKSSTDVSRTFAGKWQTSDWIWLAVFLLALMGLIASIIQRKGVLRVAKGQKDVRQMQQRMDRELDGWQGEQHG